MLNLSATDDMFEVTQRDPTSGSHIYREDKASEKHSGNAEFNTSPTKC